MTEVDTGQLMDVLRRIQADVADIKADVGHLKLRAMAADKHLSGLVISTTLANNRIDRVEGRVMQVERRLTASMHLDQGVIGHLACLHESLDGLRALDRRSAVIEPH